MGSYTRTRNTTYACAPVKEPLRQLPNCPDTDAELLFKDEWDAL